MVLAKKGFPYRGLTGEQQREKSFKLLLKYIREYVYPYSPHYRRVFKAKGISPGQLKTYDDFLKIPITTKEDHIKDPRSFILQPSIPGQESAYKTENLSRKKMAQYVIQTLRTSHARDKYGIKRSFKEKIRQTALKEWYPVHF